MILKGMRLGNLLRYKMGLIKNTEYPAWDTELINFFKELGLGTPEKLKKFIDETRINNNDVEDFKKADTISLELISLKERIFTEEEDGENEKLEFSLIVIKIAFSILFIMRYVLICIKWSYQTLKEK